MATFRIELDDGSTLRVTANDEAEARSIAEAQIANPVRDAVKQVGSGIVEGVAGLPTMLARGADAIAPYVNSAEDEARRQELMASANGKRIDQKVTAALPTPMTDTGRYARTVGQVLPAAVGGIKNVPIGVASGVGTGVGAEGAGDLAEGTGYEAPARFAGGLAGGLLPLVAGPRVLAAMHRRNPATEPPLAAAPAPEPSPAPVTPPVGGGAAGRVVDDLGGNEVVAGGFGKAAQMATGAVWPRWLGGGPVSRAVGSGAEAVAQRVLDRLNPTNAPAPPPQTSVPVTKQPPRQMPWGGPMPTKPVTSVPSTPLSPEAIMARVQRMADEGVDATQGSPLPEVSKDVVKNVMAEMRTRNRADRMRDMNASRQAGRTEAPAPVTTPAPAAPAELPLMAAPVERAAVPDMVSNLGNDYVRPLPGARRDVPMDPAMLQALIARSKASAPAPAPTPPPSPVPQAPAMPPIADDLSIPDFLRRTPQAGTPPQAQAAPMPPPAPMPQAVPPAPVAAAIPEDLSIPDFLRRNPATITKKDGKVEAKMEPALTKPTQKADYDRGEALRKEKADADAFNTMKVEAGDDLYLPAHSAARNGRTPAEAAQHIADQWKLEGKPFGTDEASFVSRLTKLMTPKFELADDLAKATGADKGILREHLIGPLDADSARQFRTDLRLSFPSASRRIDEVMSDDRIVGTWPKYTQKGGKPRTPAVARRKPTKRGSDASTDG